jgi:hypothetical protein
MNAIVKPDDFDWKAPDYSGILNARLNRLEYQRKNRALISRLKEHYKSNPVDFINDLGMTFDPRLIEIGIEPVTPFVLFPRQVEFIDWTVERWKNREDGLVEKSRDMGLSWLCVSVAVWMWLYHGGSVIGFGSRKEEYVDKIGDPKSLFWKVRQFINLLPSEYRPRFYQESKHAPSMRIINPENGAVIVGEAGTNIGRGNRTAIYFKDESAFYEQPELIDAALSQTSNCKLDVSTPNGVGNPFHEKRMSRRIPVFRFHWTDDPRKDEAWYAKQKDTLSELIVAQEIDIDYTIAGRTVFCRELLKKLERECYSPDSRRVWESKMWQRKADGELRVWSKPQPKRNYVIGADVAEGLAHGDFSCADVLDQRTGHQVAQWHGKVEPDRFGQILCDLGDWYNNAYIGVERNNHGLTTLVKMRDTGYSNIHAERDVENKGSGDKERKKLGWLTTRITKPLMIDGLSAELREGNSGIVCKETVEEMRNYIVDDKGGYNAQVNCFDDRVMARAIAGEMRKASWLS